MCACVLTSALLSTLGTPRVKNPDHARALGMACLPLPETLAERDSHGTHPAVLHAVSLGHRLLSATPIKSLTPGANSGLAWETY